ncbi:hypothetical protein M9H77_30714 [Catharanthus roseus]|uniref:Uncharacterized protein n=1 Tax=Catharanthus roseus TaxID=4058 RepID=A0ACB9ZZC7_CATRO|nr:hypothetical protein M9H77_30714 [Catharanthus roseus]
MAYELTEQKKIGLGLIGFGILFSFLAMILFFDRGLLALGNILWLGGVTFLLGWHSTLQLFTNKTNYKGSVSFLVGIFLIFVRWPIIGIIFELYGCILLFGGFWPTIKVFLYQIPVFGWLLQYPSLVSALLLAFLLSWMCRTYNLLMLGDGVVAGWICHNSGLGACLTLSTGSWSSISGSECLDSEHSCRNTIS